MMTPKLAKDVKYTIFMYTIGRDRLEGANPGNFTLLCIYDVTAKSHAI